MRSSLWKRMQSGDNIALANIYYKYAEPLYQYGLKITKDTGCIEDAIHELFLSLLQRKSNLITPENILFYLIRSFRNQLIKELSNKNKYDSLDTYHKDSFSVVFNYDVERSQKTISDNQKKLIIKLADSLSIRQKEAIYLKYKNGLTNEEIATVMDITDQACRNLIFKSLKRMREFMRNMNINSESIFLFLL